MHPRSLVPLLSMLASQATAQTFVETFEAGSNVGQWNYVSNDAAISAMGGNPGAHLVVLQTGQPGPRTSAAGSVFTGDFASRRVSSVGLDCITLSHQFSPHAFDLTVVLGNDGGTPGDFTDDCLVYFVGSTPAPQIGEGYLSYDFAIPWDSATLPPGWGWASFGGVCADGDAAWNLVISDVDALGFNFGDPTALMLLDLWDLGIDNVRITAGVGEASCFGDGGDGAGCTPCPCTNEVPAGTARGCLNGSGTGARLVASGGLSVAQGTLRFEVDGANPSTFGVLVSGANLLPQQGPCPTGSGIFSAALDGLRCAGGGLLRHGSRATAADGSIGATTSGWGPPDGPPGGLAAQAGFVDGQTRHFQVFYRELDAAVCQTGQNTSNAVSVTFAP